MYYKKHYFYQTILEIMKYRSLLLLSILFIACKQENTTEEHPSKTISISYNRNVETVMILRALSDKDYFISRVPDTNKKRPMLYAVREYFAKYKNHSAVGETQRLLYAASDIGGQLFQGVMYGNELPGAGLKQEPADEYWQEHKAELKNYLSLLNSFYREANADAFFKKYSGFYEGARAEASKYINDSVTVAMEQYFGSENAAYQILLLPMCPYGWAFSITTNDSGKLKQHGIISPVTDVDWDGESEIKDSYGFGGVEARAHYRELVIHEFVHPFITPILESDSFRKQIARYEYLYTPLLDSVFGEQGYTGWWSFVNEHLTRLGHIRVMEMLDKDEAEELRQTDMNEYKFVLLLEAEEKIQEYENNRDQYPTIDDFLPELINIFSEVDTTMINERIRAERVY